MDMKMSRETRREKERGGKMGSREILLRLRGMFIIKNQLTVMKVGKSQIYRVNQQRPVGLRPRKS